MEKIFNGQILLVLFGDLIQQEDKVHSLKIIWFPLSAVTCTIQRKFYLLTSYLYKSLFQVSLVDRQERNVP